MSNETKFVYASQVTLEASGAAAGSDGFVAANDTSLATANHNDYPMADFVLTADFGAAPAAGTYVSLFRQDMDIDGTGDALAPSVAYPQTFVGTFALSSTQSASASYPCTDVPISKTCQFSIQNKSGQNLSAGWVLKATPKTFGPVA